MGIRLLYFLASESSARPVDLMALWLAPHNAGSTVVSSFASATTQAHCLRGGGR